MTKFEFKSQICTTREQSEKLLSLGLKKETADCRHWAYTKDSKGNPIPKRNQKWFTRIGTDESAQVCGFMVATFIPAWSLHRLVEMFSDTPLQVGSQVGIYVEDTYNMVIQGIEWLISRGQFNQDYLEEKQ